MLLTNRTARKAFTLVELMISAAITVLIMTILSICFQTSMSAMSSMRAQGDAADQLRALSTVIKRDFKADRHLPAEGGSLVQNRGRRISDYQLNLTSPPNPAPPAPPGTGFYYLESPPSTNEGNDGSFDSYRNTPNASYPFGTRIWLTSVLSGGDDAKLFTANVGGTVFSSEAAEVAYFLVASGQTAGSPSQQLYNLYRRQKLVAIDSNRQGALTPAVGDLEVISSFTAPGPFQTVNTMTTIANGGRPPFVGPNSIFNPLTSTRAGDDIILSNVLSFEIKPTWVASAPFGNRDPVPFSGRPLGTPAWPLPNYDAPYDDLTKATANTSVWTFDSLAPLPLRINGMQIRIRIYDQKVKTARQMTMILDL